MSTQFCNFVGPKKNAGEYRHFYLFYADKNESKKAGKKIENHQKNYLQNGVSPCIIFGQK